LGVLKKIVLVHFFSVENQETCLTSDLTKLNDVHMWVSLQSFFREKSESFVVPEEHFGRVTQGVWIFFVKNNQRPPKLPKICIA
jgi:hypothetical protein